MRINKKYALAGALILVVGYLVWSGSRPKPVAVVLADVERGEVTWSVVNTRAGTVEACQRARLAPPLGGQIAHLPVKEGDSVEADQILLELWNDDLMARLKLAQRDAVASRAKAEEACVVADVARREANRLNELHRQQLASEELAEKAEGDAQARVAACKAGRELSRVTEASVEVAEAVLERTRLRAPFDGTVAEINGELGEFVTPSPIGIPTPPAVDLVNNSCLYIKAPIDEVDAPAIRAGMNATISLDAFPDRPFAGFVRRVAPYVQDLEKQARTVDIEAEIRDPEQANLLPGYSADVEVILERRHDVIRVPTQAVLEGYKVFVFDAASELISERTIEAGISNWEYIEVRAGLTEGDQVVVSIDREGVEDGAWVEPEGADD